MEYIADDVVTYVEPILRFCIRRLSNRHDAEDLASEIMLHILSGIGKYQIQSLDNWVWRIAHNRYARFIDMRNRRGEESSDLPIEEVVDDYDFVDEIIIASEYQEVFKCLHTLSSKYRNILVDYYIAQQSVREIAENYALSETTVKWRLNVSREKIKTRIGERKMDKVYKHINWDTTTCNGSMDSNKYLYSQIARAICNAAYENPLTVEEISLATGLPTMYIEDEIPRLISGDALVEVNNKYATSFIILRVRDRKEMEKHFSPLVTDIADFYESLFKNREADVARMDFYGSDFGIQRLGHIVIPAILRKKIRDIKNTMCLTNGAYPPRLDGGYGWFIVRENDDYSEQAVEYASGCNITDGENNNIYYYLLGKYFNNNIYHNGGTRWMHANKIVDTARDGTINRKLLTDDDIARLLQTNLITKNDKNYMLNFAVFDNAQYNDFISLFDKTDKHIDALIMQLIKAIHSKFKEFVPKRLDSQINQWVSCYSHGIVGFVAEELIKRGVLGTSADDIPLTDGVFCVMGDNIDA